MGTAAATASVVGFLSWFFMLVLLLVLLIMRVLYHFFACKSHYFRQAFMFTLTHSPRGIRTFKQTDEREGADNQAVGRTEWRAASSTEPRQAAIGNSFLQLLLSFLVVVSRFLLMLLLLFCLVVCEQVLCLAFCAILL